MGAYVYLEPISAPQPLYLFLLFIFASFTFKNTSTRWYLCRCQNVFFPSRILRRILGECLGILRSGAHQGCKQCSRIRTLNAIFPALMLMRIYAREWSLSLHSCAPQAERIFGSVQTQKFHMTPLRCLAGGAGEAARKRGTTFMIPPARDVLLLFFTSRAETYNHSQSGCVYTCAPHLKIHTLTSRRSHNRRLIM
jgi:hypothetical protein